MNKVYFGFKLVLLALVIVYISLIVSHEVNPEKTFFTGKKEVLIHPYTTVKSIIVTDPYKTDTLEKVESAQANMADILTERASSVTNMTASERFTAQITSFRTEGIINNIDDIIEDDFGKYTDFRDLIIIDSDRDLIYKYGTESFAIKFYEVTHPVETREFDDLFGVINLVKDEDLDYTYEVIAIFNYTGIRKKIQSMAMPAYINIYDHFITNEQFPYSTFEEVIDFESDESKTRFGLKILETFPIDFSDYRIAQGGVVYPVRSLISYSVIILKVLGLIAAFFFLFLIDRSIHLFLKKRSVDKAEVRYEKDEKLPKSANGNNIDEEKLNWVKSYIRETENGK